ncbi:hypothetical protein HELRODRAFT_178551 [Helobdella robusta]|uniref:Uncharacterized protein n=1 Tax=Helobdella robusta TaxID=6412 RepID=T1FDC9_HELRO|nr:hypothetical protein HELRODRAFT_178551 [Helobdella robusta]ESN97100.1 hypothetical protein HELRODRAFT_178551 [Helobdella robusta]
MDTDTLRYRVKRESGQISPRRTLQPELESSARGIRQMIEAELVPLKQIISEKTKKIYVKVYVKEIRNKEEILDKKIKTDLSRFRTGHLLAMKGTHLTHHGKHNVDYVKKKMKLPHTCGGGEDGVGNLQKTRGGEQMIQDRLRDYYKNNNSNNSSTTYQLAYLRFQRQ